MSASAVRLSAVTGAMNVAVIVALGLLSVAAAGMVILMGLWALALAAYAVVAVLSALHPKAAMGIVLAVGVAIEPAAADSTGFISDVIYHLPPGWEQALYITISPIELAILAAAGSLLLRGARPPVPVSMPLIIWTIPGFVFLGLLYGLYKGAPMNLAYTESRGFLVSFAVFYVVVMLGPSNVRQIARIFGVSVLVLALLLIFRYLAFVRTGQLGVPAERAFAHESSLILGTGLVLGMVMFLRSRGLSNRAGYMGYCFLMLIAMLVTGRRAATLVGLVGVLSVGLMLLPRKPLLVLTCAVPLSLASGAYLAAFWNVEYGALAQPARAVRSQIDPNARDQSSDEYREIEKRNVIRTIQVNKAFGVGFGREYIVFEGLPDLRDFWPPQYFTPHQNVLWLWLKMGPLGMAAFLSMIVLALQRCIRACRTMPLDSVAFGGGVVLIAAILMALCYSTVDLGLTGSRELGVLAVASALGLAGLPGWREAERA